MEHERLTGVVSPVTARGTLLLGNGHLVSCFAEFESHGMQLAAYRAISWLLGAGATDTAGHVPALVEGMRSLAHTVFHSVIA